MVLNFPCLTYLTIHAPTSLHNTKTGDTNHTPLKQKPPADQPTKTDRLRGGSSPTHATKRPRGVPPALHHIISHHTPPLSRLQQNQPHNTASPRGVHHTHPTALADTTQPKTKPTPTHNHTPPPNHHEVALTRIHSQFPSLPHQTTPKTPHKQTSQT